MESNTIADRTDAVVQIHGLSRKFGDKQALDSVDLDIKKGCVFGLVGENGAGKTTLLKHILGLFRPQQGSVRVFGLSPVDSPVEVLGRVGYLSEDRAIPTWMTVKEVIRYTAAFYPAWDDTYATQLQEMFELAAKQKVSSLSRGQLARVGLLLALAYRPPLLVLDEPSSGLDPIVRRDILGAIIRTVADEGRTVLFSSHLLDEIQRVSDRFAMLQRGRIVMSTSLDDALTSHQRLTVRFSSPHTSTPVLEHALKVSGEGNEWTVICNGHRESVERQIAEMGGDVVERGQPSLEEIFVARAN